MSRSDYRDWDYQNDLDAQEEEEKKNPKPKPKIALTGVDCARIAVFRYSKVPKAERDDLAARGISISEIMLIMSMQINSNPTSVTEDELAYLAECHKMFEVKN
jgi:hypothetical protein